MAKAAVVTQHGEWSASTRYRALQHVDRLAERLGVVDAYPADDRPRRRPGRVGQALYFAAHGVRYVSRYRELSAVLKEYDSLFVQRGLYALGPGSIARLVESFDGRVVYDIDDALYTETPSMRGKGRGARWLYGPQQMIRILDRADALIVSTPTLAEQLPTPVGGVTVLPTVPDPSEYVRAEHAESGRLIGWAGTNGGLRYLDPLRPVMARLEHEGLARLQVVSSQPWVGPSEFREWRLSDEPALFASFAVGIMPLPDTEYARAKAGFKLLQYMAAGVPVVASPVGINRYLVERSGAGFLADGPEEWEEALRTLLADPDLRERLGSSGRAFVMTYANLDDQADKIATLLVGPSATGLASPS
jgi:glycosyltransferase involved in cell wall biosynthesis